MTYGRPCMIGPRAAVAVPLPQPMHDEQPFARVTQQIAVQPSSDVEFFVLSLQLFEILHDILYHLYSVNNIHSQLSDQKKCTASLGQDQNSVFELECRLASWQRSIPDHLKMSSRPHTEPIYPILHRQACILHQRWSKSCVMRESAANNSLQATSGSNPTSATHDVQIHRLRLSRP